MNMAVYYPPLDITALNDAAIAAGNSGIDVQRLFIQTDYIPAVSSNVIAVDNALRTMHHRLPAATDSCATSIAIDLNTLTKYKQALDRAPAASRPVIVERIAGQAAKIHKTVNGLHLELNKMSGPLAYTVNRNATQGYLNQLTADKERLPTDIQETLERQQSLELKRQGLTEAISLLESKGIAQIGKETALTTQEIMKLVQAGPEVAIIEKGIELAQEALEKLEGLISYLSLTAARDVVRKQIDNLLSEVDAKNEALRLIHLRADMLEAIHTFDDKRKLYLEESMKITEATQSFLSAYQTTNMSDDTFIMSLLTDSRQLVDYLKAIR